MYSIFKGAINARQFDLSDMLKKIESKWIDGTLTDAQREKLIEEARDKADPKNSIDLMQKMSELEKRIFELEKKLAEQNESDAESATDSYETPISAPEFETGKWYKSGDLISWKGITYVCAAPVGSTCVWSPDDYPAYWEVYVE